MSADAWRSCPRCLEKYEKETDEIDAMLERAYGTIPAEEYIRLMAEHNKRLEFESTANGTSMREDYSIWTDESGLFQIDYTAECTVCGFRVKYKYEDQVYKRSE